MFDRTSDRRPESLRRVAGISARQARTLDTWAAERRAEGDYASAARREAFDFRQEARRLHAKAKRMEAER